MERLLSTPGIDVNIRDKVKCFTGCEKVECCAYHVELDEFVDKLICIRIADMIE